MDGKRVGLYLRVSSDDQTVENQRQALAEAVENRRWRIVEKFVDSGISGAKGRDKRPGFDRLLKAVTRRKIDVVAVWSVDRLGRSLQHLVGFLEELDGAGCDLYLHQQALDTTTPPAAGKGRPKGARNKMTPALKEMILAALNANGGHKWFEQQAAANPVAFMALLGKVLPMQVSGSESQEIKISVIRYAG